ncbi:hypothetical protein Bpfe_026480, partial [Biomphalaria pfeifferi]
MITGLVFPLVLLWTLGEACNSSCSITFQDQPLEPVGCNETTMWTFTRRSKLSCALSCVLLSSCAVFTYSSDTQLCSLCNGELIRTLIFGTGSGFSWPFQHQEINKPSKSFLNLYFTIPNGIRPGSV